MAARITRAKKKIAAARIPYRVPPAEELPGAHRRRPRGGPPGVHHRPHRPGRADLVRRDLVERAVDLARMLHTSCPTDADVAGLLALILLTDARRDDPAVRRRPAGAARRPGPLRSGTGQPSPKASPCVTRRYAAARQGVRAHGGHRGRARRGPHLGGHDWAEIVGLYDLLVASGPPRWWPSTGLWRSDSRDGPLPAWTRSTPFRTSPSLAGYGYLAASRADFLRRLGRARRGPSRLPGGTHALGERGGASIPRRTPPTAGRLTETITPGRLITRRPTSERWRRIYESSRRPCRCGPGSSVVRDRRTQRQGEKP